MSTMLIMLGLVYAYTVCALYLAVKFDLPINTEDTEGDLSRSLSQKITPHIGQMDAGDQHGRAGVRVRNLTGKLGLHKAAPVCGSSKGAGGTTQSSSSVIHANSQR